MPSEVPRKAGAKLQQFNQTAKFFANFFTFYALLFHFSGEQPLTHPLPAALAVLIVAVAPFLVVAAFGVDFSAEHVEAVARCFRPWLDCNVRSWRWRCGWCRRRCRLLHNQLCSRRENAQKKTKRPKDLFSKNPLFRAIPLL